MRQNFRTYNRTADVNRLVFEGIELRSLANVNLWSDLFTTDYPREQTWSRGDKGSCCRWFSLMSHYNARIPQSAWERAENFCGGSDEHRPVVWLATSNHMMAEKNINHDVSFPGGWKAWHMDEYDPHLGTRACAEAWAQAAVPVKTNCFSCCCWVVQRPANALTNATVATTRAAALGDAAKDPLVGAGQA